MELLTQLLNALWAQDFETLANPSMIGIQHDLKPTYAKLKGGDPAFGGSTLKIEVTHTSFNK